MSGEQVLAIFFVHILHVHCIKVRSTASEVDDGHIGQTIIQTAKAKKYVSETLFIYATIIYFSLVKHGLYSPLLPVGAAEVLNTAQLVIV